LKKALAALLVSVLAAPATLLAASPDVSAPIKQFIDGFNSGDTKSAFAAYAAGDVAIIDEFAPNRWSGPHAAQEWAAAYDKHAKATGVTDGQVKYGAPTRTEIEGNSAYVVISTTYLYKQKGNPMVEEGQATFALHAEGGAWKIKGWTWTGVEPHPAK